MSYFVFHLVFLCVVKVMQKNTFTRWVNVQLTHARHPSHVDDLQKDLCDGLMLISLVEVLTNHEFRRVNRQPNFRTQKLENVTKALKFLEDDEGIRLVNIGLSLATISPPSPSYCSSFSHPLHHHSYTTRRIGMSVQRECYAVELECYYIMLTLLCHYSTLINVIIIK